MLLLKWNAVLTGARFWQTLPSSLPDVWSNRPPDLSAAVRLTAKAASALLRDKAEGLPVAIVEV